MRASGWADLLRVVPPPAGLARWLSAGIAVRLAAPESGGPSRSRFPASVASAIVATPLGRFGVRQDGAFLPLAPAFVSGPARRPVEICHQGAVVAVGVMVRPAAAAALLGGLPSLAPAEQLFGPAWPAVAQELQGAGPDRALQALFDFVAIRSRQPGREAALNDSARLQEASLLGVAQAARHCGCGPRQFERRFAAAFGMAPKHFHRLARAEVAMRMALASGRCDADLAHQLGYFDQSHLGRDLRELAGLTPAQVARMAQGDPEWWPLAVGAAYPGQGVQADYGPAQVSLFS